METKTELNPEILSALKELVRINRDSADGFKTAADAVEDSHLADFLRSCSDQRRTFAGELAGLLRVNDEDVPESGKLLGSLHRWWIDLRGSFQDGSRAAMLAEVERGEDAIKGAYESVLKSVPGSAVSDVLHRHMAAVKKSHDAVLAMRDTVQA